MGRNGFTCLSDRRPRGNTLNKITPCRLRTKRRENQFQGKCSYRFGRRLNHQRPRSSKKIQSVVEQPVVGIKYTTMRKSGNKTGSTSVLVLVIPHETY